jgi:serine/threonine protein kinase
MAEVFRGRALSGPRAGQEFALKRLLPELEQDSEAVQAFANEGDLARWLNHPNIVKVHEVGSVGDSYFLVMDLVDGRDVGKIIKRCRERNIPWPVDFAVHLAHTLLLALDYAHHATGPKGQPLHIVHCDVSPSNLFVSRTGDLKLGDFGVARGRLEPGETAVLGKPYYVSPEALNGDISPALDLWATTVTLYELLTLKRPFTGNTPEEVFDAIRHSRREPVKSLRPDVPDRVAELVAKGLSNDPAERFPDALSYAQALEGLYDERVGTPLAISAVVRGLFGLTD